MGDVKDILGIKGGSSAPREKAEQPKQKKPKGMSREAYALLDGSHPIMPSQLVSSTNKALKEKQKRSKGRVTWTLEEFRNSARPDDDKWRMKRWQKRVYDAQGNLAQPPDQDYWAVKYCKPVDIVQYNDEEYSALLSNDPGWTKEETDHLFDLCKRFAMRFTVMADRWCCFGGKDRTVEDLRARYTDVARKLLMSREGGIEQAANHYLVRHQYDPLHERLRKEALRTLYNKTVRGQREDQDILERAKEIEKERRAEMLRNLKAEKIEEKEEKEEEEGAGVIRITADAFNHLQAAELGQSQAESAPVVTELFLDPSRTSLLDSNLSQTRPKPGVYPRAGATKTECGKIRSAIPGGARIQKQFDTMLADLGFSMENGRWPLEMPTAAVCANFIALQAELAEYLEMKRKTSGGAGLPGKTPTPSSAGGKRKGDTWDGAGATPRASKRAK